MGIIASLSLVSASAMAGASSSASLSGLTFTLIDLDPTDGITASYTLIPATSRTGKTSVWADASVLGAIDSRSDSSNVQLAPLAQGASIVAPWGAFAQSSAEVSLADLYASGVASGGATQYLAYASVGDQYYYQGVNIDLTPNSMLLVSVKAQVFAWAGNASCLDEYNTGYLTCGLEQSSAQASMNLSYFYDTRDGQGGGVLAGPNFSNSLLALAGVKGRTGASADVHEEKEQVWSAAFTNSSNAIQSAALELRVNARGAATTAVPEASTLAMFGLGLLGMAMSRVRNAQRRNAQS